MEYTIKETNDQYGGYVNISIVLDQPAPKGKEEYHVEFIDECGPYNDLTTAPRWRSAVVKDRFDNIYHHEFNGYLTPKQGVDLPGVIALDDYGDAIWMEMTLEDAIQEAKKVHQRLK